MKVAFYARVSTDKQDNENQLELAPKSIGNYTQVVKAVVASAVNEQGEELYPRKWNANFIDMPIVDKKKQKTPIFAGEVVTGIVRIATGSCRMLFILCAAAGLRIGEALGIDIKDISPDCLTIKIRQKAWNGQIHDFLKTTNGNVRSTFIQPSRCCSRNISVPEGLACSSVQGRASNSGNRIFFGAASIRS